MDNLVLFEVKDDYLIVFQENGCTVHRMKYTVYHSFKMFNFSAIN